VFVHRHVVRTVVLTILALVLVIFSLTLPWYRVSLAWVSDSGHAYDDTAVFSLTYFDDDGHSMRDYDYYYSSVGSLFKLNMIIIVLWALLAMIYVATIIPSATNSTMGRKDGLVMGWVMVVMGLSPALIFAALIAGSYNTDSTSSIPSFAGTDGLSEWGPKAGWYLALLGGAVQIIAVLSRNVPILLGKPEDSEDLSPEEVAHGDLPLK
jgi:hypothetical protein